MDRRDVTAQPFEQRRHDGRAGAAHAVERNAKLVRPNAVDVEVRYREDTFDVSLNGTFVGGDDAELVPCDARNAVIDQRPHLHALGILEEQA
jgi:hypothetical protein